MSALLFALQRDRVVHLPHNVDSIRYWSERNGWYSQEAGFLPVSVGSCGGTKCQIRTTRRNVIPSAAERMRRFRQRRRDGLVYVGIALRVTEIQRLVALGYLKPEHCNDPSEVLLALCWFLDNQLGKAAGLS